MDSDDVTLILGVGLTGVNKRYFVVRANDNKKYDQVEVVRKNWSYIMRYKTFNNIEECLYYASKINQSQYGIRLVDHELDF